MSERKKTVSVRMPKEIRKRLDRLSVVAHLSRAQLLAIALRVQLRQVKLRGGRLTTSYAAHFAANELAELRLLKQNRK